MLILKDEDVVKALSFKDAIDINKEAFIQKALHTVDIPAQSLIGVPEYLILFHI